MTDYSFNIGWLVVAGLVSLTAAVQAARGSPFFVVTLLFSLVMVWFSITTKEKETIEYEEQDKE